MPERQLKTITKEVSAQEKAMLVSFRQTSDEILASTDRYAKTNGAVIIGLEVEYSLLTGDFTSACQSQRDQILAGSDFLASELGASQIELRTLPIDTTQQGFGAVHSTLSESHAKLSALANNSDLLVLSSGTNPFVPTDNIETTDLPKYVLVPGHHKANQRPGINTIVGPESIDVGDPAIVGLTNSIQTNIEARSDFDAIDKVNRALMLGPIVTAISANARFFGHKDIGIQDARMIVWEISHDTRTQFEIENGALTRIGLPANYYANLADYFNQVAEYPFILDAPEFAFDIGIGLNWRDARIKFVGDSMVVEFRPISTQPTIEENIAVSAFFTGRLLWSQATDEPLLPMHLVHANRINANTFGHQSNLWTLNQSGNIALIPASQLLPLEIQKSIEGFRHANIPDIKWVQSIMKILKRNIKNGTPSHRMASIVHSVGSRNEGLIQSLQKINAIS